MDVPSIGTKARRRNGWPENSPSSTPTAFTLSISRCGPLTTAPVGAMPIESIGTTFVSSGPVRCLLSVSALMPLLVLLGKRVGKHDHPGAFHQSAQ